MNEVSVPTQEIRPTERLSAAQIRADVNLIQEVMKAVMIDKVHYGTVPGCGDKPTLLKPGAEKIASTFRLAIDPVVEDLSTSDEIRYRVAAKVTHQTTGTFLGSGIGEASTSEEKYKWRKAVSLEEYNSIPDDRRRLKYYKEGQPAMQVRTNPADVANTVLKMAKKRALVDAVLTITAASDCFTQDIEDMPEELATSVGVAKDAPIATPQAKDAPAAVAPTPAPANGAASHPARDRMRKMECKFDSKCKACTKPIKKGDSIYYDGDTKSAYHVDCA